METSKTNKLPQIFCLAIPHDWRSTIVFEIRRLPGGPLLKAMLKRHKLFIMTAVRSIAIFPVVI